MPKDKIYAMQRTKSILTQAYFDEYLSMFCNAVKILGLPDDIPQYYILKTLFTRGVIAKYGDLGIYRPEFVGLKDIYGEYKTVHLTNADGQRLFTSVPVGLEHGKAQIIKANAIKYPYAPRMMEIAETLAILDISMRVNVLNSQTNHILPYTSKEQGKSIERAFDEMQAGLPVVLYYKDMLDVIQPMDITAEFKADKIQGLKETIWNDSLKRLGIVSENNFKKVRVQSAEVDASIAESIDYVYTMIDSFNYDCERNNIPWVMEFDGYVAKYDTDDIDDTQNFEQIKETEETNDD